MSYKQIAQDYFESSLTNKLPQDFKSREDRKSGLDVHAYSMPRETMFGPGDLIEILNSQKHINKLTMFMLFSAAASGESL